MTILVAIPTYDGKLPIETVRALLDERAAAILVGDDLTVEILPACSHPAMGRNQLAQAFVDSSCERLFFLDSDVTWPVGQLIKLAHSPVDFVGGAYRHKLKDESYPVGWDASIDQSHLKEGDLIEVASLPGGFLSLSRNVFERLKEEHPERTMEHFGHKMHGFFEMPFNSGEDGFFCKSWRDIGGKVFLDPEIELTHWDFKPTQFKGHIGNYLKSRIAGDRSAGDAL